MSTGSAGGAFSKERETPWKKARGIAAVAQAWMREEGDETFALDRRLDGSPGAYAPLPAGLTENLRSALARRGISELYSHQARSFELVSSGRDVVIATPTASGKSLCYHVPVLDALARDPMARAIYLFPTKALSRDQEDSLRALMRDADLANGAITYDGDTPGDARRVARERSAVLITNPDMLHSGILPHHPKWQRLFANLRYVVIDELHSYRGVFGSHLANVLRRLRRIAAFHGSSPTFVFASATIGNPKEHASRMIGRDVELVDESGAPEGPKRVLVYNPPLVNQELGIRRSYLKCAVSLACDLVRADVSTLVFGQSRNTVEVMLKYLRDRLTREKIDPNTIHAYRGGYLPDTRRRIEAGLRSGEIKCVVATNALELGIDIGSLDAVICAGYPGSVAALWQRFGRGGRRKTESLSVLVTSSAPLDQYVAGDPSYIAGAPIEQARIDPDNVEILIQHIKCAAFELPFAEGDPFGNVPPDAVGDALEFLATNETLNAGSDAQGRRLYHWASDAYPANHVSLRSASWDNFVIIELPFDKTIAEMDWRSTHTMLHEQAIYQHEGEQYQVERLDYENHKAFVRKVAPDYYTTALTHTDVDVLEVEDEAVLESSSAKLPAHPLSFGSGEVSVREKVVGYKKIKYHTHENVGYGDVYLPEMQMHTSGFWIVFPEALVTSLGVPRPVVIDALRGLASALHTVASAGLMIDPRDLGRTLGDRSNPEAPPGRGGAGPGFDPTIFLWDHIAGGIGLAPRLFVERDALLRRARTLVHGCACDDGCPACIGPSIGITPDGRTIASELGTRRRALLLALLEAAGIEPLH
jgi:DEAD/DEAH box helicase domain-containing protein